MPIILYPVDSPATTTIQCDGQKTVQPEVGEVEGRQILARTQAIEVVQGQESPVTWIMRNRKGEAVDLTHCFVSSSSNSSSNSDGSVKLRLAESFSFGAQTAPIEIDAEIEDGPNGVVTAQLTEEVVELPGIFRIEWAILDSDGKIVFTNQGYLLVNRGLFGSQLCANGPLSIPEIRLHLRDNGDDNFLIDYISEWDLAELISCMERPVRYFNESSPPIDRKYNTKTFPFRFNWLNGIVAGIYETAAHHYRRNSKSIQAAGGVNLDDKQKATEYEAKSQSLWTDYKRWVQTQKASMNADAAFGGTSESCDFW